MFSVLLKAFSFIFVILLGYGLKRLKVFGPKDYTVLVKVVLNTTLPAAVITSFASMTFAPSLILVTLLGILLNCLMLGMGLLLSRGKPREQRALYALALPGYNIGAFATPFALGFLGADGGGVSCLFDTGNAIMCTGGSYAVTDMVLNRGSGQKHGIAAIGRKLLSSVPFVTYVTMLILTLLGVHIPQTVVDFINPIANANPYAAMLMIGMMFELDLQPEKLKTVGLIVLIRNLFAIALSLACYFLLPLPLVARQTLAVVVFAPPSVLTPAFTEKCGGDASLASCVTSLCILTAIICMITTILLLHIA